MQRLYLLLLVSLFFLACGSQEPQQATTKQLTSVHQLLDTTNNVTSLMDQNLESSQQIASTTEELSSQADILLQSVDRFKLNA